MKNYTTIGIDPGANGALCFMLPSGLIIIHRTSKTPPLESMQDVVTCSGAENCVAFLEKIGGFIAGKGLPGSSMFKMGHNAGYWEGMLAALGVRTIMVRPQDWQKGITGTAGTKGPKRKRALRDEAIRRFPAQKPTFETADALLIADYGRRNGAGE